jgi:hypothetical protein
VLFSQDARTNNTCFAQRTRIPESVCAQSGRKTN